MKKLMVLSSVLLLLLLAGCSSPKESVKELSLSEIINIPLGEEISTVTDAIMVNDKIYCVSALEKLFAIMDLEGNIVKLYNTTGNGPGELAQPATLYHDIEKNTIGVLDALNVRISHFDLDGNHVEDVKIEDYTHFVAHLQMFPTYKLEKYMNINTSGEGPMMTMNDDYIQGENTIPLGSSEFNLMAQDYSDGRHINVVGFPNKFYTYFMHTAKYEVFVYDTNGDLQTALTKDYKRVNETEERIKLVEEQLESAKNMMKQLDQNMSINSDSYKYKQAVNKILLDEQNRTWILTQNSEASFFDLFDETGNLIAKCPAATEDFTFSFFNDGKIYSLSVNEEEGVQFKQFEVK